MSLHLRWAVGGFCLLILSGAAVSDASDFDEDTIEDSSDNCPFVSNNGQADDGGFDSTLGDGIGNACQCGDVFQSFDPADLGVVNVLDFVVGVRLLNGLVPPGAALELCNTVGPFDGADADHNGVPNDCGPADVQAVRERLAGIGTVLGTECAIGCEACLAFEEGRALLCRVEVVAGDKRMQQALALSGPGLHPEVFEAATVMRAVSRLAVPIVAQNPSLPGGFADLLNAAGVGAMGRDPLNWTATVPFGFGRTPLGEHFCTFPAGVREADAELAIAREILPQLNSALAALPSAPADLESFCDFDGFGFVGHVELDFSDVLLLRAHLHALRGALRLVVSYDLDFDLADACNVYLDAVSGTAVDIPRLLVTHPTLLTLPGYPGYPGGPAAAEEDFRASLALFEQALDALKSETDDQLDDLFSIDPLSFTPVDEALLRARIDQLQASFDAPTPPDANLALEICGDPNVFAGALFDDVNLRSLLPAFVGDRPLIDATLPDPTFAGVLPGQTVADLRCNFDTRGPEIALAPAPFPNVATSPLAMSITFSDADIGASPGHAINAQSATLTVDATAVVIDHCALTINGLPVATGTLVDVTSLFAGSVNPDGSLSFQATLASSGIDECYVLIYAAVEDDLGNASERDIFFSLVAP